MNGLILKGFIIFALGSFGNFVFIAATMPPPSAGGNDLACSPLIGSFMLLTFGVAPFQ